MCVLCDTPVWAEDRWNGLTWVPTYHSTSARAITHCLGCGEQLRAAVLAPCEEDDLEGYVGGEPNTEPYAKR